MSWLFLTIDLFGYTCIWHWFTCVCNPYG